MAARFLANTRFRSTTRRPSSAAALAAAALLVVLAACTGPPPQDRLVLQERQEREVKAGDLLSYEIPLAAEQYVELVVDQRAVDVAVALKDSSGKPIIETDSLLGAFGPEKVLWIAPREGVYRLEIRAPDHLAEPGRCTVSIEALRPATEEDRRRTAAAAAFYEAEGLRNSGETDRAIAGFKESLELWSQIGDGFWQALSHFSLGYIVATTRGIPSDQFPPEAAIGHLQEAINPAQTSLEMRAAAYFYIGRIHAETLFDLGKARSYYEESLRICQQTNDHWQRAATLNSLGYVYKNLGELHRALGFYDEALGLWRELADSREEANTRHNRGKCYRLLGRTTPALEDFHFALAIWENAGERQMTASALTGIAEVLTDTGNLDESYDQLSRAMELYGDNRRGRALVLVEMGEVYARKDERGSALKALRESLEIFREMGDRRGETAALTGLGRLTSADDPEKALELFHEAAVLNGTLGIREIDAAILMGMAGAYRHWGKLEEARQSAERAIQLVEMLRGLPESSELRSSYFATKQSYYDFYIELLIEIAHRDSSVHYEMAALAASERSRARSLLDMLAGSGIDFRWEDHGLVSREKELERQIESLYFQRTQLSRSGRSQGAVERVQAELRKLLDDLDQVRVKIRASDPVHAAFTQPEPLQATDIQSRVLDEDTLLLEYHLGEARSLLWVMATDSIETVELPGRNELEKSAEWVYQLLTVPRDKQTRHSGRLQEALRELSDELILPVANRLNKKRLLIVADGALQYVPFAALPVPSRYDASEPAPLVADHEVVSMPSASALAVLRQRSPEPRKAPKGIAVVADPVFGPDDPRAPPSRPATGEVTSRTRDAVNAQLFARLPFSRLEAEYILAQADTEDNLLALGFDATGEIAASGSLADYRYVHFATHSVIDNELPELSSLVFSQIDSRGGARRDGFLRMHQVYQMSLQADLVTLSACRTATGKRIAGEGLVGWTQGFMYSGARRVLVSLWSVDDEATAELMAAFYRGLLSKGLPAAAALREAQNAVRSRPEWRSPYYWASFVLQGEYL